MPIFRAICSYTTLSPTRSESTLHQVVQHTGLDSKTLQDSVKVVRLGEISVTTQSLSTTTAAWFCAEYIREHADALVKGRRVCSLDAACGLAAGASGSTNSIVPFIVDGLQVSLAHASAALSSPWTRDSVHIVIDDDSERITKAFGPFDIIFVADSSSPQDAVRAAALARGSDGQAEIYFAHTLAPREDGTDVALLSFINALGPEWVCIKSHLLRKTDTVSVSKHRFSSVPKTTIPTLTQTTTTTTTTFSFPQVFNVEPRASPKKTMIASPQHSPHTGHAFSAPPPPLDLGPTAAATTTTTAAPQEAVYSSSTQRDIHVSEHVSAEVLPPEVAAELTGSGLVREEDIGVVALLRFELALIAIKIWDSSGVTISVSVA
jgi:hypothetical protein